MPTEIIAYSDQSSVELKKHVAVIHSHSKISLLQRKISNALLFHAYDNLLTQDDHEIQISTLTKLIDYDSHDHKKIKQALMDLLATVVEWNIVDGDKLDKDQVWNASSIIADASIDGSLCTYSYSGKMRKLLYHPSVYGRLNMKVQAKFQSSYGLALYENCNRYQDIGQTPTFDLNKFRKLMGVDDNKYKIFRDFKTRVIDKSVEEVNKFSSMLIEPKFKRNNRQVVAIQFCIKKKTMINENPAQLNARGTQSVLKDVYGLSQKQINDTMNQYDEEYIKEKIKIIELSPSFQAGKIKNMGKYLLCALSEDYQLAKKSKPSLRQNNLGNHPKIESSNNKYLIAKIPTLLERLTEERKEDLLVMFKNKIIKTVYLPSFEKRGLNDSIVNDQFIKFILSFDNEISCAIKQENNLE